MQLDETLLAASLDLYHLLLHSHEGKEECPARDGCTTRKKLETVEFRDVRVVLQSPWRMIDQSDTTTNAANEWGVQRGNANDDAVGTARPRTNPSRQQGDAAASGADVVMVPAAEVEQLR